MFSESTLAPELIKAYLATNFRVDATPHFVLKVGAASVSLAQLLEQTKTECATYLTACNPLGQLLDDANNARRQSELEIELTSRSLHFIRSLGQDSKGEWPGETSVLILGLSLEAARVLGGKYDQNAFVWCGQDAVPQLILLK